MSLIFTSTEIMVNILGLSFLLSFSLCWGLEHRKIRESWGLSVTMVMRTYLLLFLFLLIINWWKTKVNSANTHRMTNCVTTASVFGLKIKYIDGAILQQWNMSNCSMTTDLIMHRHAFNINIILWNLILKWESFRLSAQVLNVNHITVMFLLI